MLAAAGRVRLLGAVVPIDARAERARLVAEAEAGRDPSPRWTYAPVRLGELAAELGKVADRLRTYADADGDAMAALCAARARELALEAQLAECTGTRGFGARARLRFDIAPSDARRAEALARAWAAEPLPPEGEATAPTRTSSGPETQSLLTQMRRAIGEARVPFTVEVRDDLLALAATGERTVFVAKDRPVTDEDVLRTVAHEVLAHVLPRARAQAREPKIFQLGTARGADDQEGYALLVEARLGLLTPARRRSLALRHLAATHMDAGATFVECVRALRREHDAAAAVAVTTAERVYRGGDGERPGLGRERVYLASFDAVRDHLAEHPEDEDVLTSGQVALEALPALRELR